MANNESLKCELTNSTNHLSKTWWWLVFRYFERNVPCNLPPSYGWPIPKKCKQWNPMGMFARMKPQRLNDDQRDEAALRNGS